MKKQYWRDDDGDFIPYNTSTCANCSAICVCSCFTVVCQIVCGTYMQRTSHRISTSTRAHATLKILTTQYTHKNNLCVQIYIKSNACIM